MRIRSLTVTVVFTIVLRHRAAGASPPPRVYQKALELLKVQLQHPIKLVSSPRLSSNNVLSSFSVTAIVLAMSLTRPVRVVYARCRNQPGDPGYPTDADWAALNDTTGGRLVRVVPSVEACRELGCTKAQWASGIFRQTIPGAMNAVRTVFQLDPGYHR
jgi:hypothetical protein